MPCWAGSRGIRPVEIEISMNIRIAGFPRWMLGIILAGCFLCQLSAEPEDGRRGRFYDLRPNDMIEIKVFQEDDLNAVLRISKDGMVNFPLIGVVRVGGKSPQAAAATIRDLLARDYLVNPQVSVTVKDFSKQRFTVLGEVQKPGAYEMPDQDSISLLEAIGMAGGYTRIAEPAKITLKRVVNGTETVIKLNAKKMAKDKNSRSIDIKPGDVVTVGERFF
jgi:protein involved in polysaccharide export with SLBB domain